MRYSKIEDKTGSIIALIVTMFLFFAGFILGYKWAGVFQEPKIIEKGVEKAIHIDYNGLKCTTLTRDPELHYRTDRQTVTLMIECSPDILFHFTPAVPESTN